jgi:hypothetical protein
MKNDSPHLTRLVQRAPLDLLRQLLAKPGNAFSAEAIWKADAKQTRAALKDAIPTLPASERRDFDRVCERIDRMTDEAGAEAINQIREGIFEVAAFEALSDQYGRSLWLYLREPENFQRAEDARYADAYRGSGRIYSAFKGPRKVAVNLIDKRRKALLGDLAKLFRTADPILLDHFVRPRTDLEHDGEVELHQFSIQHNGERQSVETIQADGDVGLVYFCPANSVKVTYEPANGVVEIYARDRNLRPEVFKRFAKHVLDHEVEAQPVPLRNYDIASLAADRYFPLVDPEIASVRVAQLRLRVGARGSALELKVGDRDARTLYGLAAEMFGDNNPLEQAYRLDQARIVIRFHRLPGQRRAKSLVVVITTPNGCNIKSHTDRDRQLAEKYLRLWGLVEPDEGDNGAEPEGAEELAAAL